MNIEETAVEALRGPVRLRTLTTLRWMAVGGQTAAIAIVHFFLGFPTPIGLCIAVIAASAWLNIFTILRFSPQTMLSDKEAAAFIAFDIVQLCALLYLTGGLQNPFSALILAPVTIGASVLSLRLVVLIATVAVAGITFLAFRHLPLPWAPGEAIELPIIYNAGVWTALTFSTAFFAAYARRIAAEGAQMKSALAASQIVLAREERLAALGGLAAAAAHELGTPLATIQVTAKEMANDLAGQGHLEADAKLLVSQAERCRDILGRLSNRGEEESDKLFNRASLDILLREAASPFLEGGEDAPAVVFDLSGATGGASPVLRRKPEIVYGLRNLIENAAGFASTKVVVSAHWDEQSLEISIHDDGPGFSPDVLTRLGEPYVSMRPRSKSGARPGGLGLGFFIAKTLLERSGASIAFDNRPLDGAGAGAWVSAAWALGDVIDAPQH